ncbi:uncharacterized protein LOC118452435 [Egretta garzetta]|uniref:uncharacterized protein LOC118452435 n=1 Tax=Egretta garzetta TaxID=188379 RepID=UPI00163CB5A6|nr:uncharacterized protein LOC118452435 [Egretta garzetta]
MLYWFILVHTGRTQGHAGEEIPGKMLYWCMLVHTGRTQGHTGEELPAGLPYWSILVHAGMAEGHVNPVIPVGMLYWSIPLRPKAMHTWGSQLGPQTLPGPYWSGPRQRRSRSPRLGRRSGSYWSILVHTRLSQGDVEPQRGGWLYWSILGCLRTHPMGIYGLPGGLYRPGGGPMGPHLVPTGIYRSPKGIYKVPTLTYRSPGVSVGSLRCPIGPDIGLCVPKEDLQVPTLT